MVRNPSKRSEPEEMPQVPQAPQQENAPDQNVQVIEREVTLSLINDKLNYLTGLCHRIAEACDIDLSKN